MSKSLLSLGVAIVWLASCQTTTPEVQPPTQKDVSRSVQSVAVSLLNKGKPDLALKELRPYHLSHPEDSEIINVMGLCHLALRQPRKAEALFASAYGKSADPAVALNLSSSYLQQKKWGRAVSLLKKIERKSLPKYPHPERVYHNLAAAYAKQGNVQLSRRTYDKALTAYSSYLPSLLAKARLNMRLRKYPAESYRLIARAEKACARCFQPIILKALWSDRHQGRDAAMKVIDDYAATRATNPRDQKLAQRLKTKILASPKQKVIAVKSLPKSGKKE